MYDLIRNGNFHELTDRINKEGLKLVKASFAFGVLNALVEKSEEVNGELVLVQGHNPQELMKRINDLDGAIEYAIIDKPCKYFFVRTLDEEAKKERAAREAEQARIEKELAEKEEAEKKAKLEEEKKAKAEAEKEAKSKQENK